MALLYRFVKLDDRPYTHVFHFVVTRSVTRDLERDITSKEFACGHHRWAISFSRTDKVLGVFLVWKSTSENMRVYVDFSFTLLNRQHFSVNETFSGKQVKFTPDSTAQGNRNFISVAELYTRNFTDPNGEFQLELCMGHVRSSYDALLQLTPALLSGTGSGSGQQGSRHQMATKLETSYFSFGGFDWNIAFYPLGLRELREPHSANESRIAVFLNRCTGFDHQCRIRFNLLIGDGENALDSGIVDDVSDSEGKSYGWHARAKYTDLIGNGTIHLRLELILANTICELVSHVTFAQPLPGIQPAVAATNAIASAVVSQCYDRDKQAWTIKCDCHSETVRIHMVYKDIHNIPRNHLRYVNWKVYMLRYPRNSDLVEPVKLPGAPFSHYYSQEPSDEGIIMETDIPVKELRDASCLFITEKNQIRVQIEWGDSYMLFQSTYHKYDDVIRLHNQQMRREIATLQTENYSLERQLVSYQKTIAFAHSRGANYSEELATEESQEDGEERALYRGGVGEFSSLAGRSFSTDTEYV